MNHSYLSSKTPSLTDCAMLLFLCRLSFCGITDKGCSGLASALSSNPSHLRQLDLSYNYLQDSGAKLIVLQQDNPLCKLEKLW